MYLYLENSAETRLIKGGRFPFQKKNPPRFSHRALIGIGGNVGDVKRRFEHLWVAMERSKLLQPLQSGMILENPPFGYALQPMFLNTVLEIATPLSARALLRLMWRFEHRFGRIRSFKNAPRTLDLDIIFYDRRKFQYPDLIVPHPFYEKRPSVMIPLRSLRKNIWYRGRNNR